MMLGLGTSVTPGFASAITQMEGKTQNNNPGNLMAIPGVTYAGQVGVDSRGFAIFDSLSSGQAQLQKQIDLNISRGLTTEQFFCGGNGYPGYAPNAGGNDCAGYAAFVANQLGIDPNTPLNSIVDSQGNEIPVDTSGLGDDAGLFGLDSNTTMILAIAAAGAVALWLWR